MWTLGALGAVKRARIARSIPGWTEVTSFAVGGLQAVGFDEQTGELIVVSSQGQGIFDPISGERLFRDAENDGYDWRRLLARRGDKPEAPPIRMSGIHGGHLRTVTDDGWTLEKVVYAWPEAKLVLCAPNYILTPLSLPSRGDYFVLGQNSVFKIWGFSYDSSILVWSDEVDVRVLKRE